MDFAKLWNTIETVVDPVADFLLGEDVYDNDALNVASKKSRSGGFLSDILGKGARAYVDFKDSEDDPNFAATQFQAPQITRYRPTPPRSPGGATPNQQILGASNPRFRKIMQRARSGYTYANSDMNSFGRNVRVAINLRQGRRTQQLERPAIPSVKEAKPAEVRKEQAKGAKNV